MALYSFSSEYPKPSRINKTKGFGRFNIFKISPVTNTKIEIRAAIGPVGCTGVGLFQIHYPLKLKLMYHSAAY